MKPNRKSTIRRIIVPLDPSKYAESATEYACQVAKGHESAIAGLAVLDTPEIRSSALPSQYGYLEMIEESIDLHKKHAEEEIDKFENAFRDRCLKEDVIATEIEEEGVPFDLILEAATLFDLMVIGLRTFFHFETRTGDGELLSKILGRTSTPILAVPPESKPLKKVLIAYDGSPASARAVRDFAVFAQPFEMEVDLFLADEDTGQLDFHANKLHLYLNDHDIPVSKIVRYGRSPLEAIEQGLTEGYDLIVCGMHSKRPLHDFFVGSFANRLIEREESALFLSH